MHSEPIELSPAELELAEARLAQMTGHCVAEGTLRTPQWRAVFARTWRHPYVPSYYPDLHQPLVSGADPQQREQWLDAVYSDQTLITKVVQVHFQPPLAPGSYPMYTCSSTAPVLMLSMLEALDVRDGDRVLEIGTGTGYNAALLCERLGSEHVTSVDIDPELIELARARLSANGYHPTIAAVDGAGGYPPGAPYDRIIATCGVLAIPPAWLQQTAPGSVIVVDVHGEIGGTLARLTVDDNGVATGRFLSRWASFMSLRHTLDVEPPPQRPQRDDEPVESTSEVDPKLLRYDGEFSFVAQWHLPGITWGPLIENGEFGIQLYAPDGSSAIARSSPDGPGWQITQYGPGKLWDRVEDAYEFWQQAGRPATNASASPPPPLNSTSGSTTPKANTAGRCPLELVFPHATELERFDYTRGCLTDAYYAAAEWGEQPLRYWLDSAEVNRRLAILNENYRRAGIGPDGRSHGFNFDALVTGS